MFSSAASRGLRLTGKICSGRVAQIHVSSRHSLLYGYWAYVLGERTTKRFGPNSKIITVDGNLASGKGQIAKKLADRLGMRYFPEADEHYLDKTTGDGSILPSKFSGNCSLDKFYDDPKCPDGNSYRLQSWMYSVRLMQYSDALEHLLSTGQGAVLERSPFSDFVFLEAMYKNGYIRKQCIDHYNEIKGNSIDEFLPPHLVIYVDVPAAEVHKKILERGHTSEKKVALPYLQSIENTYKESFLPQIRIEILKPPLKPVSRLSAEKKLLLQGRRLAIPSEENLRLKGPHELVTDNKPSLSYAGNSEILKYTGNEAQDVEKVVEDIEYLKFDKSPWTEQNDVTYHHLRMFVEDKDKVASLITVPSYIPEITIGASEYDSAYYQYRSLPGRKYTKGYNADIGDKMIWLK
ncbi:NADH:ubiquinone oxidoreductase subunit A10 L homeolog isoform X1 [Xenopus laevis]|uniref:NADH dehydrogenase [ubiquinone] 1 alpha subcomplex subunit 10, mitochondrial n=1 Tax=Xenopus laevis TaxID=8355 RepID=A0A8J1LSD2_XENLA|nr:NADH:ubiquinone oxidoreductase subunit A10 L homeolog isoform X1 [Xenopus laevis]